MANRKDKTQTTSAAKAGFSERSARRIESGQRQLGPLKPREYRTRKDPLEAVWEPVGWEWIVLGVVSCILLLWTSSEYVMRERKKQGVLFVSSRVYKGVLSCV